MKIMALIKQYYLNSECDYTIKVKVHHKGDRVAISNYIDVIARNPQQALEKAEEVIKTWENVRRFHLLYIENITTGEIT